jgi:hypothetical protein
VDRCNPIIEQKSKRDHNPSEAALIAAQNAVAPMENAGGWRGFLPINIDLARLAIMRQAFVA